MPSESVHPDMTRFHGRRFRYIGPGEGGSIHRVLGGWAVEKVMVTWSEECSTGNYTENVGYSWLGPDSEFDLVFEEV